MLTKEDIESCGHSLMWTWTHTHVDRLMWTMTHVDKIRKTWTWIHINKIRIRKNRRHRLMLPKPQQNTHHKLWTRSKPRHMLLIPLFVTVEYFKGNQVLEKPWCDQVSQLQCQHLSWIYAPEAGRDPLHIHIHNKKLIQQLHHIHQSQQTPHHQQNFKKRNKTNLLKIITCLANSLVGKTPVNTKINMKEEDAIKTIPRNDVKRFQNLVKS